MTLEEQYQTLILEGNRISLPSTPLPDYPIIRYTLIKNGGKYKKNGFDFDSDPTDILNRLIGGEKVNLKKDFQFYETPSNLADTLIKLSEVKTGMRVLEPSAGRGAIVEKLLPMTNEVVLVEYMESNFMYLSNRFRGLGTYDYPIYHGDYLEFNFIEKFDRVIANPPFNKNQDVKHVMKMYDDLKDGGILVSIMSIGWQYKSQKICKEFRDWLGFDNEEDGWKFSNIGTEKQFEKPHPKFGYTCPEKVYLKMLDQKEFKSSGANVRSCIVVIHKAKLESEKV